MSLGSWDPAADAAATTIEITPQLLRRLSNFSEQEQLADLASLLDSHESQSLSGLMKLPAESWQRAADELSDDAVVHLIRFFAVAENLPGWEAGPDSPVIPLARCLRKRGAKLDKPLLLWLREVNANRFLPYGPL